MTNNIKINEQNQSGLSEFTKRPLPTDDEVRQFDSYVENKVKEEEIKDSLTQIYKDDDGSMVNVKKLDIKKNRGMFFSLFLFIFTAAILAGAVYGGYFYLYKSSNPNSATVSLNMTAPKEIIAGQEFFYEINYKNNDNVSINNVNIKINFPENFVLLDAEPAPAEKDNWQITDLASHRSGQIKIKGKLISESGQVNTITAAMTYQPANFSSEFKKEAQAETTTSDLGLDFSVTNPNAIFIGEDYDLVIKYTVKPENYLNNLRISFVNFDSLDFKSVTNNATTTDGLLNPDLPGSWLLKNINNQGDEIKIKYQLKESKPAEQNLILKIESTVAVATDQATSKINYLIYQKEINFEIIKSDLNLSLIVNGSNSDQGADFGQTLNYSVNYANKGEQELKDVIIMAVLEGDWLNWQTLKDDNHGQVSASSISWSKLELPQLAVLAPGAEGSLDFSINIKPANANNLPINYQIKSYLESSADNQPVKPGENQSNIIVIRLNSNLNLNEQIRYFNDDNIAVGSGPLPPKVGETTSFKVYWTITNNINQLSNLTVTATLPDYVKWDNKKNSDQGELNYDSASHKVIWRIDKLPLTLVKATAEFNISLTPEPSDRNKILVLLPATNVSAQDNTTNSKIEFNLKAKTTKLENDTIANTDGVVE